MLKENDYKFSWTDSPCSFTHKPCPTPFVFTLYNVYISHLHTNLGVFSIRASTTLCKMKLSKAPQLINITITFMPFASSHNLTDHYVVSPTITCTPNWIRLSLPFNNLILFMPYVVRTPLGLPWSHSLPTHSEIAILVSLRLWPIVDDKLPLSSFSR